MTTVGTDDGRNYARINLKLAERGDRAQTQKEIERAIREGAEADPRHRAGVRLRPAGLGQPAGPGPGDDDEADQRVRGPGRQGPGIADLETSEKAAQPALSIRLNNDAAADLGITVQQVGATVRPLLAGDTVSYWLGPDGQNYEVNVQLAEGPAAARVGPRQPLPHHRQARPGRRGADGAAAAGRRDRRDDQPADHQAAGAAAAGRAVRERRGAPVRRRQHGRRRRS